MTFINRIRGNDSGAVLVMTALLAVALIGITAFAVDLGNAFARKRLLQTQADLAALAGAGSLPDANAASAAALTYLRDNQVVGGQTFTADDITVFDGDTKIRVTTPPATVSFGFAQVLGFDNQDVTAVAEAGIFTPGALAPFFIAEGCAVPGGSRLEIKTDPGNVTPTPIDPAFFEPVFGPGLNPVLTGATTPFELEPNSLGETVSIPGDNLDSVTQVGFVWGESTDERIAVTTDDFTIELGVKKNDPDILTVVVPNVAVKLETAPFEQTRTVFLQVGGVSLWSPGNAEASFTTSDPGVDIPDECGEKSTGDFGLIDSPREGAKNQKATQQNVAEGLDHAVYLYPGGSADLQSQGIPIGGTDVNGKGMDTCVKETASPPFVLDTPSAVEPNCFEIYTGNKPQVLDLGLIEGDSGYDGRLDADATEACGLTRDVQMKTIWTINDDLLSCYIRDSNSVSDVLSVDADDILEGRIVDSPRFLIVPIIYADYPPQNGSYPIVDYRGAMISAELQNSTRTAPKPEPDNGLIIKNKSVGAMTVTYFELQALPEIVSSTGSVLDYIGTGPKDVRLIR